MLQKTGERERRGAHRWIGRKKNSEERTQKRDAKRQSVLNRSALRHKNEGEGAKTILGGDQSKEGDKKMFVRRKKSWSKERRGMTGDPAALRKGSGGRSESGSVPQTQYLFEVVDDTQAAAEGCGSCARCEGRTRCSRRETRRSPRGRKGNTGERRRERRKDRGTGGSNRDDLATSETAE